MPKNGDGSLLGDGIDGEQQGGRGEELLKVGKEDVRFGGVDEIHDVEAFSIKQCHHGLHLLYQNYCSIKTLCISATTIAFEGSDTDSGGVWGCIRRGLSQPLQEGRAPKQGW